MHSMEKAQVKKPSIARNGVFYLVFSVLNALFPFLTSLYVARVLSSDAIGQVSYAINIVTYFSIFAFVGIPTYGMREIAKCRDDKISLNKLFTELFTINTVTTTIALAAYIGLVFIVPDFHLHEHLALYLFCGILVVLNYFNVTWLYEGVEKFSINAIVNVCTKLISFVFLVLFVKSEEHSLIYAILAVVGFSGYYLVTFFFFPKYAKFDFKELQFKRHFKPILFLVVVNLAIEIYSLVDITMIGAITGEDSLVTYYKYAHQIQKTLLMVVNALTMVIVPRLSKFYKEERFEEYNDLVSRVFSMIIMIAIPMIIGIMFTADQLVVYIYGDEYLACSNTLKLLSANLIISPLGYLLGSRICLTANKEKYMPIAVGAGALVNIGLNAWLIHVMSIEGAAIASIVGELVVLGVYLAFSHKYFRLKVHWMNLSKILIALVVMTGYLLLIYFLVDHMILKICLEIAGAIIIYFGLLAIIREEATFSVIRKVFHR